MVTPKADSDARADRHLADLKAGICPQCGAVIEGKVREGGCK